MNKYIFRPFSLFITFTFLLTFCVDAQYYYKDILSNIEQNKEFSILKDGKIKTIKVESFDEKDQPSNGFFCEKKINKDFSESQMISKSNITEQSLLETKYDKGGRVTETTTNTPTTTNTIDFEYNSEGLLSLISTKTTGDVDSIGITETHQYVYKNGKPEKMIRKVNGVLVSTISFVADDKGNVIEEDAAGTSTDKKYYYYYDDQHRLTDVVHYNVVAKRLLPDYMFEYENGSLPVQKISVDETARSYFIWRYAYNDKQLPEIQKCYSKAKDLLGTIQFDYLQ
ncbi:MAG TPA: hypothetical protein VIJ75_02455 [Hanamia sp.]